MTSCRAEGTPTSAALPTATVLATATPVGEAWVLATTDGLVGYLPR